MQTPVPLRALHAPPPLPWPGPTPFEWVLVVLTLVAAALLAMRLRRQWLRRRWRRSLAAELALLESLAASEPANATRGSLSLIRRILLLHHPREQVASITGARWLEVLDALCGTEWFTADAGRGLVVAGFARPAEPATVRLALDAARRLVEASLTHRPDPPDA